MPVPDNGPDQEPELAREPGAARVSRRSVLRGAAGAGAAGLAMTAFAAPVLAAARPAGRGEAGAGAKQAAEADDVAGVEDVVVHVRSVRSGELDVYRGTSHVRVTDKDLAVRLARASK
jgi:secreted PhoX family phosphatase